MEHLYYIKIKLALVMTIFVSVVKYWPWHFYES